MKIKIFETVEREVDFNMTFFKIEDKYYKKINDDRFLLIYDFRSYPLVSIGLQSFSNDDLMKAKEVTEEEFEGVFNKVANKIKSEI